MIVDEKLKKNYSKSSKRRGISKRGTPFVHIWAVVTTKVTSFGTQGC